MVTATEGMITARLLNSRERVAALPKHFGRHYPLFERFVYRFMEGFCEGYQGGYWEMYKLSNNGFYMALNEPGELHLVVEGNGFSGSMSADAAGLVVTSFAINYLMHNLTDVDCKQVEALTALYFQTREFALDHAEAKIICQAID